MIQEKELAPKNTAKELLSKSLQELQHQRIPSDAQDIADRVTADRAKKGESKIVARTVQEYMRGSIDDLETGKEIFKVWKSIIIKRENEIKKLVA